MAACSMDRASLAQISVTSQGRRAYRMDSGSRPLLPLVAQTEIENTEQVANPAWLDHSSSQTVGILGGVAALFLQLLTAYKYVEHLDYNLAKLFCVIMFAVFLLATIHMKFKWIISARDELSRIQKMILMSLNLLTDTAFMAGNVVFLGMVDKSYLSFASIPVTGFILLEVIFYSDMQSDENQGSYTEYNESVVKICFKVGYAATILGYSVLTAVGIVYMNYPKFQKEYPDHYIFVAAFLTLCIGSFARTATSSPLHFPSERVCYFVMQITHFMLVLLGLEAVFLSAECLKAIWVVFAVIIPVLQMFVVNLFLKQMVTNSNSTSTKTGEEVASVFVALVGLDTSILLAVYSVNISNEGHTSCLTFSAFFLLWSTISSLKKVAFRSHPAWKIYNYLSDALPWVETLVGFVLLLIEIGTYI